MFPHNPTAKLLWIWESQGNLPRLPLSFPSCTFCCTSCGHHFPPLKARLSVHSSPLWPLGIQACRGAVPEEQHNNTPSGCGWDQGPPCAPRHSCPTCPWMYRHTAAPLIQATPLGHHHQDAKASHGIPDWFGLQKPISFHPLHGQAHHHCPHQWLWHLSPEPGAVLEPSLDPEQALLGL